jgi:hypothetical protein
MNDNENSACCPNCGASMSVNRHGLTRGLVKILIKFRQAVLENERDDFNRIHAQRDVSFTKNEYANFQKLRYFGLIAKCKKTNGERDIGYWLLTRNGNRFIKGLITQPKYVKTFRNSIVEKSKYLIDVKKASKSDELPYFQQDFKYDLADVFDDDIKTLEQSGEIIQLLIDFNELTKPKDINKTDDNEKN